MLSNVHNNFRCWEVNIFLLPVCFHFFFPLGKQWYLGGLCFVLVIHLQYLGWSRNKLCYQHLADIYTQNTWTCQNKLFFASAFLSLFSACMFSEKECFLPAAVDKTLCLQDRQTDGFLVSTVEVRYGRDSWRKIGKIWLLEGHLR